MKKLIVSLAAVMVAFMSQANYLMWQVSDADIANSGFKDANSSKLYAYNSANKSYTLIDWNNTQTPNEPLNINSYEGDNYSFYVELANYNEGAYDTVARSESVSYAQLGAFMTSSLSDIAQAQVWHASNYSAAPEPTSALLMMMGVAFLGLKRRKA